MEKILWGLRDQEGGWILVVSTVADGEQGAMLRHRAAVGQLADRVAADRAGDDDAICLRDLLGPIAVLPTGNAGWSMSERLAALDRSASGAGVVARWSPSPDADGYRQPRW